MSGSSPTDQPTSDSRRESGQAESQLSLCTRCKEAGILELLNGAPMRKTLSKVPGRFLSLGDKLVVDSDCAICDFFDEAILGRNSELDEILDEGASRRQWRLGRYTSLQALGVTYSQKSIDEVPNSIMSNVYTVSAASNNKIDHNYRSGFIVPCFGAVSAQITEPRIRFTYTGRAVFTSPNWRLIAAWLDDCENQHVACKRTSQGAPLGLKVIDCHTETVIQLPSQARYVALSYVWGRDQQDSPGTSSCNPIQERTIHDSMAAVNSLGLRYLWVDRLCINQDDPDERKRLIKQMDMIYEAAYLTFVVLVSHSDIGIPGISVPRTSQPSLRLPAGLIVSTVCIPGDALLDTDWNTRAWTYQEFCLSRRCLVFDQYQAYFLCKSGATSEAIRQAPLSALPYQTRNGLDPRRLQRMEWENPSAGTIPLFERHLNAYCQRVLTEESDALDAFRGFLARSSLFSYWGVPVFKCLPNPATLDHLNAGFAHGICWASSAEETDMLTSRSETMVAGTPHPTEFPSWSWTSCRGLKHYHFNRAYGGSTGKRVVGELSFHSINVDHFARFYVPTENGTEEPLFSDRLLSQPAGVESILAESGRKLLVRSLCGDMSTGATSSIDQLEVCFDNACHQTNWASGESFPEDFRLLLILRQTQVLSRSPAFTLGDLFGARKRKREMFGTAKERRSSVARGSSYWIVVQKTSGQSWRRVGVTILPASREDLVKNLSSQDMILE